MLLNTLLKQLEITTVIFIITFDQITNDISFLCL